MQGTSIHRLWGALMSAVILFLTMTADAGLLEKPVSFRRYLEHTSQDAIPPSFAHTNQDGEDPPDPADYELPMSAEWDDDVSSRMKLISMLYTSDEVTGSFKPPLGLDLDDLPTIDELIDAQSASPWLEPMGASGGTVPLLAPEMGSVDLEISTSSGTGRLFVQPIPVPGAMSLLGLGLAGALARRRRRL